MVSGGSGGEGSGPPNRAARTWSCSIRATVTTAPARPSSVTQMAHRLIDELFGLKRELFRRWITMLLAADSTVVFLGRFVQLEVTVGGKGLAPLAERLHFPGAASA